MRMVNAIRRLSVLTACVVFAWLALGVARVVSGAESQPPLPLQKAMDVYSKRILASHSQGEYRQGIVAAAEYEHDLLGRYNPPTYEMGLLQSEAEHIRFHCAFDTWKPVEVEQNDMLKALRMLGFSMLLAVEGPSEQDRLVVFCMNAKQLEHRAGGGQAGITLDSDRGLTLLGQMIASQIGIAKSSSFKSIGDHRVLWQEIAPAMLGPDVRLVLFPHDGMLVTFLLLSASGDTAANTSRLEDTIRTVSFDYKPASASMIVEERSKCDRNDVGSLVRCAGRLAWMGQYSAAAEDLGDVRLLLRSRLPKPKLSDLTATIPAYGISVTNPDPERWKISVLDEGVMEGVLLEDRFSVNGEGIMIGVLDFVTTYGPQVIELLQDEEMKRQMLINGGRGGCMSIGQIERERFAPVRGQLAYEASILPNMAGVKARCQFISGQGCGLMVLVIGASVDFADKTAECDRVVRDCVSAPDLFTENKVVSQLRK